MVDDAGGLATTSANYKGDTMNASIAVRSISVDYQKFVKALEDVVHQPVIGVDMYTAAMRQASGINDLVLTAEQRRQCKLIGFSTIYGSSGPVAMSKLVPKKGNHGR